MAFLRIIPVLFLAAPALAAPVTPPGSEDVSLEVWKDPLFAKKFVGGFGVLGGFEPEMKDPERAIRQKIQGFQDQKNVAASVELLQKSASKDMPALYFLLGNFYFEYAVGDNPKQVAVMLNQAVANYKEAIKNFPSYREAYKNMGLAQIQLGQHREAIASIHKAISLGATDSFLYGALGSSLLTLKQPASAEMAFRLASMFEPDKTDWKRGLLGTLYDQKKYREARALLDELIQEFPDKEEFVFRQADVLLQLEQFDAAAENLEILARAGKCKPADLQKLGTIYIMAKRPEMAYSAYCRALDAAPESNVEDLIRQAEAIGGMGGTKEAREFIGKVKSTNGDKLDKTQLQKLTQIQARIAASEGATDEQIQLLEEVIALNPTDAASRMIVGRYYLGESEYAKADAQFDLASKIPDFEADALTMRAQVCFARQQFADALPFLKRADEIKPKPELKDTIRHLERSIKKGLNK